MHKGKGKASEKSVLLINNVIQTLKQSICFIMAATMTAFLAHAILNIPE